MVRLRHKAARRERTHAPFAGTRSTVHAHAGAACTDARAAGAHAGAARTNAVAALGRLPGRLAQGVRGPVPDRSVHGVQGVRE